MNTNIDDLCVLFEQQQVWCTDDNVQVLQNQYDRTCEILENVHIGSSSSSSGILHHLQNIRKRYQSYLAYGIFTDVLQHLRPLIETFIHQHDDCLCTKLCIAHYVDQSILSSIDDSNKENEACMNMED